MDKHSDTQAAIQAGQAMAKQFDIEGVPAVLLPEGAQVKTFENLLPNPLRTIKETEVRTADHFIAYYNRFANTDSTIYVTVERARFRGVIDHYGANTDNCDHSVVYTCPETEEWKNWKSLNDSWMSQDQFAEFLQDHHLQIFKPTPDTFQVQEQDVVFEKLPSGTDMLEIAKTLQVTSNSAITSGQNLHNGAMKFEYNEEINGSAGAKGEFEIPVYFVIGVELFKDGKGYLILCRLKYRKTGPDIKLKYELVRPNKTHEAAVKDVIDHIQHGQPDPESGEVIEGTGMALGYLYEVV